MKRWVLPSMLAVVAAVVLLLWQPWDWTSHNVNRELIARLQTENRDLRAEVDRLRSRVAVPEVAPPVPPSDTSLPPSARVPASRRASPAAAADQSATIQTLRESLAASQRTAEDLQSRTADLQSQLEKAKQEERRLAASEHIFKEQLDALKARMESSSAELARRADQIARLETALKKGAGEATGAASKSAQVQQLTREIQDLHRRREAHITTILSRFRDLTEQYRTLANLFESRRGPEGAPGPATVNVTPELGRIQSTIGMVEEDLRQLNSLNAQAMQLQKKLAAQ